MTTAEVEVLLWLQVEFERKEAERSGADTLGITSAGTGAKAL